MSVGGVVRRWGGGMVTADPWAPGDVAGDLVPSANNTYDIGVASTGEWKDLHLAGDANIGGQLLGIGGTVSAPALCMGGATDGWYNGGTFFGLSSGGTDAFVVYDSGVTLSYGTHRPNQDNTHDLGQSAKQWSELYQGGAHIMSEMTAPSGTANKATIYAVDNGSGKTQLMVIFGSGAAQQIAIEP